jgi:hypothetical protein
VFSEVRPLRPSFPLKQKAFQKFPEEEAGDEGISKIITGKSNP